MTNMNMAAMSSVGGPVGGIPMTGNGQAGASRNGTPHDASKMKLNTYIYDYFLKNELYDCARALLSSEAALNVDKSGNGRRQADGADGKSDVKDDFDSKIPNDLPIPAQIPGDGSSFLHDWWCLFWDIFAAQSRKGKASEGAGPAMQYVQHTQTQQRLRQEQQQHLLRQLNPGLPRNGYELMQLQRNGMSLQNAQNELRKSAMQNSRNTPTPQQAQMLHAAQMKQQQMQRQNSSLDMNGEQRAQSPSSVENAPSPSKRPRLENGVFNGQAMGPNGRGQPQGLGGQPLGGNGTASAAQANQMLIQHGINPNQLTAQQFNSFQSQNPSVQQKSIQVYAQNLADHQQNQASAIKGMQLVSGANQGSPMLQQMPEAYALQGNMGDVREQYGVGPNGQMRVPPQVLDGPGGSNHALHDYQKQLMMLEQQNKRRLMMARQEQDSLGRPDGSVVNAGQPGFQAMSPQGSRSGPSPNPQDQMARGTPTMTPTGLPGSPLPDGTMPATRGSPAAMGFGQNAGMTAQQWQEIGAMSKDVATGAPNGPMMRPPSSHPHPFNGQISQQQVDAMTRQQPAARMGQNWQQPQAPGAAMMQQQPSQQAQQTPQMGNQQSRSNMPPPQAPPVTNNSNTSTTNNTSGRTQPPSPQQTPAPPTPSQTNKPNPKGKKEGTKKAPRKKGTAAAALNAGATPSSTAEEPPATPTPSTPITPSHPSSFATQKSGANGSTTQPSSGAAASVPAPAPVQNPQGAANGPAMVPPPQESQPFGTIDTNGADNMNLDFATLASFEGNDLMESIDFDSFLNTDDAGAGGALNFDLGSMSGYGNPDGVEAGAGDV